MKNDSSSAENRRRATERMNSERTVNPSSEPKAPDAEKARYINNNAATCQAGRGDQPAVTSSTSPADVPSEGRGECSMCHGFGWIRIGDPGLRCQCKTRLPFNLSDALAGKPVVTRSGRRATNFRPNQEPETMKWCQWAAEVEGMDRPITYSDGGRWDGNDGNKSPLDLFMLPTEGSGA